MEKLKRVQVVIKIQNNSIEKIIEVTPEKTSKGYLNLWFCEEIINAIQNNYSIEIKTLESFKYKLGE